MRNRILSFIGVAVVATTSLLSSSPATAYQPVPTNHLHTSTPLNILALSSGAGAPMYSDLGDLQAGRYVFILASGITDSDGVARSSSKTTLKFTTATAAGTLLTASRVIQNGVPTQIDWNQIGNPGNDAEMLVLYYPNQNQKAVTLDIWSPNL